MTLTPEFLDTLTTMAESRPGSLTIPWPSPGLPGGWVSFANFTEWRDTTLTFRLPASVPRNTVDGFDRALKLYLLAWIDFDLITSGEMAALASLEHALRDCYLPHFMDEHIKKVTDKAKKNNRVATAKDAFRPGSISLATLLKHMVDHDELTDKKLPCCHLYGGCVVWLLTGDRNPSLAEMRNQWAHGSPFGSGYQSGLLEVAHDLIQYAYRDQITATHR